jgi:hypothetical protein
MPNLRVSTGVNYLHIPVRQYDQSVYRIVRKEHLLSLLATRENALVKPERWHDPFENFILKSHFVRNGELVTIGHRDLYYGQCWTLQRASDAMWRIYSPDSTGIRIRSTIRKLAESLENWRAEWAAQEVYVGKVRYLTTARLLAFGRSVLVLGCNDGPLTYKKLAETLLVKRPAFQHEREIRLLFKSSESRPAGNLPFNPGHLAPNARSGKLAGQGMKSRPSDGNRSSRGNLAGLTTG